MFSITEIVLLLVIILLVFGLGKLNTLGKDIKQAKESFKEGYETGDPDPQEPPVHLSQEAPESKHTGPKPGTRSPGIEDAEIEEAP